MSTNAIKVLDLFAGAGGLSAGFHQASNRFQTVQAVEWEAAAAAAFSASFPDSEVYAGDIKTWLERESVPEVDVVIGGPPCQGFSTLNRKEEEDSRNDLWREYANSIVKAQPQYFVVENVAAFAKSPQYIDFQKSTQPGEQLEDYTFDFRVLNAADYGAAQARKRTVIIGHKRSLEFPGWPPPTHSADGRNSPRYRTVGDALEGIPYIPDMDAEFDRWSTTFGARRFAGSFAPRQLHWSRAYTQLSKDRFASIPAGGNRFDLPDSLLAECWKKHRSGSADVMGRLRWDRPSVTIRTEFFKPEKGRYLHPDPTVHRAITHYEAARIQGFPDSHRFVGSRTAIAKQIGNAVPIPLGAAIGRQLAAVL
jgi:DNA (cytosine-5)-methyltransferase 1